MELVIVLLVVAVIWLFVRSQQQQRRLGPGGRRGVSAADVDAARRAAEEDVTRFGEELGRLDADVSLAAGADEALLQDWQRALDSYESAKRALEMVQQPEDVRHV